MSNWMPWHHKHIWKWIERIWQDVFLFLFLWNILHMNTCIRTSRFIGVYIKFPYEYRLFVEKKSTQLNQILVGKKSSIFMKHFGTSDFLLMYFKTILKVKCGYFRCQFLHVCHYKFKMNDFIVILHINLTRYTL